MRIQGTGAFRGLLAVFLLTPVARDASGSVPGAGQAIDRLRATMSQPFESCALGRTDPTSIWTWGQGFNYLHIFELVRPGSCETCPSPVAVQLQVAKWRFRFFTACSVTVRLSLVAAVGAPECLTPDTTRMLCAPTLHSMTTAGAADSVDFTMPLPGGCCIDVPAFLRAEIVSQACLYGRMAFWRMEHCARCEQYYAFADDYSTLWDFCTDPDAASLRLWAEGTCCGPTPTVRTTWGRLKSIYR